MGIRRCCAAYAENLRKQHSEYRDIQHPGNDLAGRPSRWRPYLQLGYPATIPLGHCPTVPHQRPRHKKGPSVQKQGRHPRNDRQYHHQGRGGTPTHLLRQPRLGEQCSQLGGRGLARPDIPGPANAGYEVGHLRYPGQRHPPGGTENQPPQRW